MKIKKYSGDEERSILTALVVSDRVCGKVIAGLKSETKPFESKWGNLIFKWCADFYRHYGKAPKGSLQTLFIEYANKSEDAAGVELIEKFLLSLSDDWKAQAKEINTDFIVDMASRHFSAIRYTRLKDSLEEGLLRKDMESVKEKLAEFHPISFEASSTVEVLTDVEAWKEAVEVPEDQSLITYPGALGEFFGPHLQRDGFISLLAPEKRGKSWWLLDIAWRASVKSKRRVVFFSVGDMSKRQNMQRIVTRAARRPIFPAEVSIPKAIRHRSSGEPQVKTVSVTFENHISQKEWRAAQKRIHAITASDTSLLRMECSSNSTTTVDNIRTSLDEMIRQGWVPDVVVIDYADILAPEVGSRSMDFRHQQNETWKALRRLSQDYHILVVTATQSDADSYDARVMTKKNFSEDKRKMAHVTGMVGINQTDEEKRMGIYRLNWILLREGVFFENQCVTVAGCLALANPAMCSMW